MLYKGLLDDLVGKKKKEWKDNPIYILTERKK